MIYTVTFNPALDYVVHTGNMKAGMVNRLDSESIFVGGKGINVSLVLAQLGVKSRALGFVAGFTGDEIERGVAEQGIEADFVHLDSGLSRINVKIHSQQETELNAGGPQIPKDKIDELIERLDEELAEGDTLVLAGSVPKSMPEDIYEKILERLDGKGIRFVVDATGQLLINVLNYKPFLIKPNNYELSELFAVNIETQDEIVEYARLLRDMGAQNVLVSMADDGAILVDSNDMVYYCPALNGTVINSVGAGDAMLAGFIAGYQENGAEYALKLGTACGGVTAFSEGLAKRDDIIDALMSIMDNVLWQ